MGKNRFGFTQKKSSGVCLFCNHWSSGQSIHLIELSLNDNEKKNNEELENLTKNITSTIDSLVSFTIPRYRLYDYLIGDFDKNCDALSEEITKVINYLKFLRSALEDKMRNPSPPFGINKYLNKKFNVVTGNAKIITEINAKINQHNQITDEFQTEKNSARLAIEESLIAENLSTNSKKVIDLDESKIALKKLGDEIKSLEREIEKNEKEIREYRRPAEELNDEVLSYLGRDELTFELHENGYRITRNGNLAENLSEGEKTAIAFLYFLKSLSDTTFSLVEGVVVIDDPVSSLDSNAIFHAFGFMKEKTENAKQLFILTHNHAFFRQVKNWINHLPKQKSKGNELKSDGFYMLMNKIIDGDRTSTISNLDSLLYKYDSEYQFLFSIIYDAARSEEKVDLKKFYYLPNIARRFLESFLAFRQPIDAGFLSKQIENIEFDKEKKIRILRFLHTYSHADQISEPEHDPINLSEGKQILKDLLELIEREDKKHFDQMIEIVAN